jgi:glucose/arabinose dehydrogenase
MRRLFLAAVVLAALAAVAALAARGGPERATFRLQPVARGLSEPVHVTAPRNEKNNVYVVEKPGRIRVIVRGRLRARPFLNITRLVTNGGEQGLLSVAFNPNYATNRRFYVYYTDKGEDERIVEYRSRGLSRSPVKVRQLFFQKDPYSNHNGGQLAFGPDGYLYAGTGDGGSGGDPQNRAQNLRSKFGKLLKFNLKKRHPVAQIAGYGLRNPWRFSFDRETGDLYIGDVGQDSWEELDYTPRTSPGLENYGWRV